jgi:hypothetical protein
VDPVPEPLRLSLVIWAFEKRPFNAIPNVTVWRVLRERLHLKAYELFNVEHTEHEYHCKAVFETPCIIAAHIITERRARTLFHVLLRNSRSCSC